MGSFSRQMKNGRGKKKTKLLDIKKRKFFGVMRNPELATTNSVLNQTTFYLTMGEFFLIPKWDTTPSKTPQTNGKIERFHQELGKIARIHSIPPDEAVIILQTELKKALFLNGINLKSTTESLYIALTPASKNFQVFDFVYREIQLRKRAKQQDTFSGPHMITKIISPLTVYINSDKNYKGEIKVHIDQLKPFVIPDTSNWSVNIKYLVPALEKLGLELFQGINVVILKFQGTGYADTSSPKFKCPENLRHSRMALCSMVFSASRFSQI